MAKKNKEFSFDDINAELENLNPLGSVMEHSSFSEVTEWIDTGNYHLNACVSGSLFKGWPNNRSCSIAGPSGCLQKNEKVRIYKLKSISNVKRQINRE